jgi:hypothetical protein
LAPRMSTGRPPSTASRCQPTSVSEVLPNRLRGRATGCAVAARWSFLTVQHFKFSCAANPFLSLFFRHLHQKSREVRFRKTHTPPRRGVYRAVYRSRLRPSRPPTASFTTSSSHAIFPGAKSSQATRVWKLWSHLVAAISRIKNVRHRLKRVPETSRDGRHQTVSDAAGTDIPEPTPYGPKPPRAPNAGHASRRWFYSETAARKKQTKSVARRRKEIVTAVRTMYSQTVCTIKLADPRTQPPSTNLSNSMMCDYSLALVNDSVSKVRVAFPKSRHTVCPYD